MRKLALFIAFALVSQLTFAQSYTADEAIRQLEVKVRSGEMTQQQFDVEIANLKAAISAGTSNQAVSNLESRGLLANTPSTLAEKKRMLAKQLEAGIITDAQFRTEVARLRALANPTQTAPQGQHSAQPQGGN